MGVKDAGFLKEPGPFQVAGLVLDRRRIAHGPVPVKGEQWSHICRFFEITEAEEASSELANIVRKKRIDTLVEIARDLEAVYLAKQSSVPDAGQLVLYVLEGCWLRDTIIQEPGKKTVCIDTMFAFVHKRCLKEQSA